MAEDTQQPVHIAGVQVVPLIGYADERGSLAEVYRREWVSDAREVVQANVSRSRAGVLRGLHFHRRQSDHWCFVSGRAFVALVDLRGGSPTELATAELRIDAEAEPRALWIPPGVAHGYYAETDVTLLYLVDEPFTGEDESGLAWNDPDVGIGWPNPDPILSERDRTNPGLAAVREHPPAFG